MSINFELMDNYNSNIFQTSRIFKILEVFFVPESTIPTSQNANGCPFQVVPRSHLGRIRLAQSVNFLPNH